MISVITPCLNICKEGRLESFNKMMDSIHNQTYNNLEHIVIDGKSYDETLKFLKRYQELGWINILISEKDSGIYSAMNKGINLSRGNFIQIMNTDDYFTNLNYFEKCINILQDEKIDFTHADRIIESKKGGFGRIKKGEEEVAFFRMPFRHQTMIVKRELFDELGFFDESYEIASDYKFVMKMLLAGKKGFHIPKVVLSSLDGGISSNKEKCIEEVGKVIYEVYGKKNKLSLNDCRAIYKQEISSNIYSKILKNVKNPKILNSLTICYGTSKS